MRKRYADAGSVKRPEAVDPQNGEVADRKESEEEKQGFLRSKRAVRSASGSDMIDTTQA